MPKKMDKKKMPIQKLLDVQKIDLKIQGLESEASVIPRQIKEWESSLSSYHHETESLKQEMEERKKEQRQLERQLEQKQNALVKYNTQLPQIKTNREYKAILLEVDTVEKEIADLEEQILQKMDEVEETEKKARAKEAELKKAQQEMEKEKQRLQQRKKTLEESIRGTRSERNNATADLDTSLLTKYDRIRVHKGGLAVAALQDESCGACHMALPPQLVNEVIGGRIKTCPSCSRLLYWEEQEGQEEEDKPE
jgi:predicted  nucleic acid-binding Zn-ribbon protein